MERKPVFVVLGATGGIGSAVARQLASAAATVGLPSHEAGWLLSPQATWVTGQVIGIDGGLGSIRGKVSA